MVELVAADSSLWESRVTRQDADVVRIERRTAPIPDATADLLMRAWMRALTVTHRQPRSAPGLDGVTYEFAAFGPGEADLSDRARAAPGCDGSPPRTRRGG